MSVSIDAAYRSLNKHGEELCGDKVEIVKTEDSEIMILADGMGSGVKANILATLTSKILATMLEEGADIESCVETIAKTLPICKVRGIAYATFSILQIYRSGEAYLVEYDNPGCVFIRDGKIVDYPFEERLIEGKKIREYRFRVRRNDCFVLMSDGVIYAGAGEILNLDGWTWESMANYTLKCTRSTLSAARLAAMLSEACSDLYDGKPGDDTTVAVVRIISRKSVNILTGPPQNPEDDDRIMRDFMESEGIKVVAGGTTANIAAKYLKEEIQTIVKDPASDIPPEAVMKGIDLVTEGVITLGKCLDILLRFQKEDFDAEFFRELDADNGASRLAKLILEDCTHLRLFVGKAQNSANKDSELPFRLGIRGNLVKRLVRTAESLGKQVTVDYY